MAGLVSGARRTLLNLHAGDVHDPAKLEAATATDLAVLDRGIAVRTVCPQHFVDHAHIRAYAELLGEHGAVTRFADDLPHRLIVVDGRVAIVPVDPKRIEAGAVVVRDPTVVACLHHLGVTILHASRSLAEAIASAADRPTAVEREVLLLMSSGLTDAVSAKRLFVTERQFRRYVARVMDRLGATSRFQAGVRAVERGWL